MQRVRHALQRNPLAALAACAVLGVLIANKHHANELWSWLVVALIMTVWALRRPNIAMLCAATALTFGFIHLASLSTTRDHPLRSYLKPTDRVTAIVHGEFVRAPMMRDDNPAQNQAKFRVRSIELPTRGKRFVGATELRVWLTDHSFVPVSGEYRMEGTLSLVQRAWNPSTFEPESTALSQGFIADFSPRVTELIKPSSFSISLTLLRWAEASRAWISRGLSQGIEGDEDEMPRTLITTMALGTSESNISQLREPFRRSGTLHVFAVSGLHVALLAMIGWTLLRPLGVGRLQAILILAPSMFIYAYITGWVPSAARAAVMSSLMLLAPLFCRDSRTLNSLGAAALILLGCGTLQMFQPGFQLSFIVLGAIAIGAQPFAEPFKAWAALDPFLPPRVASISQRWGSKARTWLVVTLATSTAATLGSIPLMYSHFHTCTPVSVVSNAVLVPLSEGSLFLVTLSLISGALGLHAIQVLFNNANWLVAHLMMWSATFFASIPGGNFDIATPSLKGTPLATLDVLAMPTNEGAQLLMSGNESWMLDCGSERSVQRTVMPVLRYENVPRIDGVILSHSEAGHCGGALTLADHYSKMQVFTSMLEPSRFDARTTKMWQTQLQLDHMGRPLRHVFAGSEIKIGQATIHVLYPSPDDFYGKADDRAIVARIDCGGAHILWCSDAGFKTEKALLERFTPDELCSDVIVRNRHATDLSSLPEFLQAVAPSCLISSYSPPAGDRAASPRLARDCKKLGITLLDQTTTGFVRVQVFKDHIDLEPWIQGDTLRIDLKQ